MLESMRKDRLSQVTIFAFILLTIWWIVLNSLPSTPYQHLVFGAIYGTFMSLFGSVSGIVISQHWGGFKSVMGKAIIFLSLGLFAEFFGQIVFSYYNIFAGIDIPYPSLADVGYFSNIPLYILGIILLSKASGIKNIVKSCVTYPKAIVFPLIILTVSYFFFLKDYAVDWSAPLNIFLDFGYPLGQATYVSLAILIYFLSRKVLGGIMRNSIIFFIVAFIFQYLADYNFLFQTLHETWINGGYGDYLYLIAYTLMTLGLLQTRVIAAKIRNTDTQT